MLLRFVARAAVVLVLAVLVALVIASLGLSTDATMVASFVVSVPLAGLLIAGLPRNRKGRG